MLSKIISIRSLAANIRYNSYIYKPIQCFKQFVNHTAYANDNSAAGVTQLGINNRLFVVPRVDLRTMIPEAKKTMVLEPYKSLELNSTYNPGLLVDNDSTYVGLIRGDKSVIPPIETNQVRLGKKRRYKFRSYLYPLKLTPDGQSVIKLKKEPVELPQHLQNKYPENLGMEDPRLFRVNGESYAFSNLGNYASNNPNNRSIPLLLKYQKDAKKWVVVGEIGKPNVYDRNFVFWGATKIDGRDKIVIAHRPGTGINIVALDADKLEKLAQDECFRTEFWAIANSKTLIEPNPKFFEMKLGAGTSAIPIPSTANEYLSMIFTQAPLEDGGAYTGKFIRYALDKNGVRIISRSSESSLKVSENFEKDTSAFYPNCTFPTSANLNSKTGQITIHYGVCDKKIGVAKYNIDEILQHLDQFDSTGRHMH